MSESVEERKGERVVFDSYEYDAEADFGRRVGDGTGCRGHGTTTGAGAGARMQH